jgi:cytochrome P450
MVGIKLIFPLLSLLTMVTGPVVRTAPNDLSFATPSSAKDIYKSRVPFPKTKFFGAIEDGFQFAGVGTEIDVARHLRERKILNAAFTLRAIREYEPLVVQHLNQFLDVIEEKGKTLKGVNLVDWFQYLTFDTAGDLMLGESFGSLERGEF